MIHKVKDLSNDQKAAIESLSDGRRSEILSGLEKYFEQVDANRQPATPQEADAIIDEALRSTRPHYQPIR